MPDSDSSCFQPEAERVFPDLMEAQRKEREGFVTLRITPEMRAAIAPIESGRTLTSGYLVFGGIVYLIIAVVLIAALGLDARAVVPAILLVAVALYFPFARWMHGMQLARAQRLQTYFRYAGQSEITEEFNSGNPGGQYVYKIRLASPPVPPQMAVLRLSSVGRHEERIGQGWRTVEITGTGRGAQVYRIRDERDHVIYLLAWRR